MRSDATGTVKAFATLRFAGDLLDPSELTQLLQRKPKLGYKKGQPYRTGPRGPEQIGKTGLWYFSTKDVLKSRSLQEHLNLIGAMLTGSSSHGEEARLLTLQQIVERQSLRPVVTCFWHGAAGATSPTVPLAFETLLKRIHGEIETDFDVDDQKSTGSSFAAA